MAAELQQDVVVMHSGSSIFKYPFLLGFLAQDVFQGAVVQVGHIFQGNLLAAAGQKAVVASHERGQSLAELGPFAEDVVGIFRQPCREDVQQVGRHFILLEQLVALHQQLVVVLQVAQVCLVGLRQEHIDETATLAARIVHQGGVGRGRHHYRDQADVVGEAGVLLLAAAYLLGTVFGEQDGDRLFSAVGAHIGALHGGCLLSVPESEAVGSVEIALGHRQVVDGVQQVSLALSVVPVDAVQPLRELDLSFRNVLEIGEADPLEVHSSKDSDSA